MSAAPPVPIHDWTRVRPGCYHDFHQSWATYLKRDLKRLLPPDYYAENDSVVVFDPPEEDGPAWREIDVLGLRRQPEGGANGSPSEPVREPIPAGGVALAEAPSLVTFPDRPPVRRRRRRIRIRHGSGDRVVALVEFASPGNRNAVRKVELFASKVTRSLRAGVHVLLIDPFPPTGPAPAGLHGAVAERFGAEANPDPARPLSFVGYKACPDARASVQTRAVGEDPPRVPLFLDPGWFVFVDLAPSYAAATADLAEPTLEALAAA